MLKKFDITKFDLFMCALIILMIGHLLFLKNHPQARLQTRNYLNVTIPKEENATFCDKYNSSCSLMEGSLTNPNACARNGGRWSLYSNRCICSYRYVS